MYTTHFTFTVFKTMVLYGMCPSVHRQMACLARRDLLPGGAGGDISPPPMAIATTVSPNSRCRSTDRQKNSLLDVGVLVRLEEVDVLGLEARTAGQMEEIDEGDFLHAPRKSAFQVYDGQDNDPGRELTLPPRYFWRPRRVS